MLLHALLCHGSIEREDVLAVNVYMVEETLLEQLQGGVLRLGYDGIILIGVEDNDILEADALLLVTADELVIDRCERGAGAQTQHAVFAFALLLLDFVDDVVGNSLGSLLHLRIDLGGQLLQTGDLTTVDGRQRTIECFRYFVQYDL